jgi:hypothetical protein
MRYLALALLVVGGIALLGGIIGIGFIAFSTSFDAGCIFLSGVGICTMILGVVLCDAC